MSTTITTAYNSDEHIIKAIIKKDPAAISQLYDKYASALFGLIYSVTGDQMLSEEILLRSFCIFWESAANYQPLKQKLFTWMLGISGELAKESLNLRGKQIQTPKNYVNQ